MEAGIGQMIETFPLMEAAAAIDKIMTARAAHASVSASPTR